MTAITKSNLKNQLQILRESFVFFFMSVEWIPKQTYIQVHQIHNGKIQIPHPTKGTHEVDFRDMLVNLINDNQIVYGEFGKQIKRTLVRETYEVIANYAELTGQFEKFKNSQFAPILRILRNATSHRDMGTVLKQDIKQYGEVHYKEIHITLAEVGTEPQFNAGQLLELIEEAGEYFMAYLD